MIGILLDTHSLIWTINGDSRVSIKHRELIEEAANGKCLCISAISLWEISILESKRKIALGKPCLQWFEEAIDMTNIIIMPISPAIAVESCNLPDNFHSDPADRIIVATARTQNLCLMTRDKQILGYSQKDYLTAIKI